MSLCVSPRADLTQRADKRYKAVNEMPEQLNATLHSADAHSPGFSIKGQARQGRAAYLDFQATTPMDPRVLDAMVRCIRVRVLAPELNVLHLQLPFLSTQYGNPHSRTHSYGWETEAAAERAREVR
jgi:cysteine desulfurase